ncbi:S-layer homology domain-containing protein [Sporosarcina sp. CAU 1771]
MNQLMKKVIPFLFAVLLVVPFTANAAAQDDISNHWHKEFLLEMVDKEIMKGYGDGIYKPNAHITRGQFAIMMKRALHLEMPVEGVILTDVTDDEMLAAAGAGLITGYPDGTFKPGNNISREHMAVIIKRALDYMNVADRTKTLTFTDTTDIYKDYQSAVSNAVHYKIFEGSPTNGGLYFRPAANATRGDAAKVLSRFLEALEVEDDTPPVEEEKPPVVEVPELTYDVASIQEDGSTKLVKKYKSYTEALAAMKTGQVVQYGTSILNMPGGIVVSKPTVASSLTIIYSNSNLNRQLTYVSADTELEYVASTDQYVQIKVAGKNGFIKHENAILMPWKAVKERSYYLAKGGILTHYVYLNHSKKFVTYQAGKTASFMQEGAKYYSWDGINYFNTNGTKAGEAYQYFQYLPARSKTNYTAEEIDAYIVKMLTQLEIDNPKSYPNALEKSKLVGLGKYLKQMEADKKVNALMMLALAQHESAYGLSNHAQKYNNLFGLYVYDDNPLNKEFVSPQASIDELVNAFLNRNYIPAGAVHSNGAVFGNKAMGFNVKYASDPYWGAKAAGHLYRMDKAMGGKDLANPYKVGISTSVSPALNVRVGPGTSNNTVFTYKFGMPFIILEEASPKPWLKIVSDSLNYDELYLSGDYVKEIPQIK